MKKSFASYLLLSVPILGLGFWVMGQFDGLYGQDPYAYYNYGTGPLRQSILDFKPPPPFFWPPGYPLLIALVSVLLGPVPRAGQLVSLISGALVPVLTALLAWEVWRDEHPGWPVPILSGLLVAFMGQLWQSSIVVMADTTGLATATLGMWALARYGRSSDGQGTGHLPWLALAAVAMSLAVLSRWAYALVAIPCTAYALILLTRRRPVTAVLHAIVAGFVVVITLSPLLDPVLQLVSAPTVNQPTFTGDLTAYSWHPLNALRRTFETADGFLQYQLPNGLYYALAPAHRFYFTPLLAPLLLPGLWAVLRLRTLAQIFLLMGWPAAVYIFHAGAPWQNFRFTLAYLPPLAILAAIGVEKIVQWLRGKGRWLLVTLLVAGLGWMAYGGWALTWRFVERKDADIATVRWVEDQVSSNSRLLTFNITPTFQHYSQLETLELFYLDPEEMITALEDRKPTYLLLDVSSVETQWQGRAPSSNYHWLQDGPGLTETGQYRTYTLFCVNSE